MEKWVVKNKKADFKALAEKYGVDPVVIRLLINRDISEEEMDEFFHGTRDTLYDPYLMKDAVKACGILKEFIETKRKIRIIGDYDIDGINATYILYRSLTMLGANVDYRIPDRERDGYGLNEVLVREAKAEGAEMILTCDNGIAAKNEIELAKSLGMTVIVTDHHDIPFELNGEERIWQIPAADAVVNPKQADCGYPFDGICGAVVAWKLMMVLFETMGRNRSETDCFLENAAFATVGDVMQLVRENRTIVKYGLASMRKTENLGLHTLILQKELEPDKLSAYHLGFAIGPCFNAGGRLDSAMRVMELLLEEDAFEANRKAAELIALNESRKNLTDQAVEAAVEQIESAEWKEQHVYCVYLPDCHDSIAGIVAGRIRERYQRPSFVITGKGEVVKGSGRSIDTYNMYDEMNKVKDVFTKFGGHPLAAGFSLEKARVEEMRRRLNENANLTEDDLVKKVEIDMRMPLSYVNFELIDQIERLEPFGNGNSKPLFAENEVTLVAAQIIGKAKKFLKMTFEKDGYRYEGIYFQDPQVLLEQWEKEYGKEEVDALFSRRGTMKPTFSYYPQINSYMGRESVQFVVNGFLHK